MVPFSEELQRWLDSDTPKSLGALNDVFEEKTFAVAIVLLMLVSAAPLPTGGIALAFEVIAALIAAQMVLGLRSIWVPKRWRQRELGETVTGRALPFFIRRMQWLERHSAPRWAGLFRNRMFLRLIGIVLLGFAIAASLAPPFTGLETLPSIGAILIALAIILEDFLVFVVGLIVGTGGVVLFIAVGTAAIRFFRGLF